MKYRTIYFDLDGTLTDPGLGITNSVIYALTRMGRTVPPRAGAVPVHRPASMGLFPPV